MPLVKMDSATSEAFEAYMKGFDKKAEDCKMPAAMTQGVKKMIRIGLTGTEEPGMMEEGNKEKVTEAIKRMKENRPEDQQCSISPPPAPLPAPSAPSFNVPRR